MFFKILISNVSEIVCRIIWTRKDKESTIKSANITIKNQI